MGEKHTREEILAVLEDVEVAAVATSEGEHTRVRMMHYATDENFNLYLASMKGDPKIIQMTGNPSVSLLVYKDRTGLNRSREVEISGKAFIVRDEKERGEALETTSMRSPMETGNAGLLDCIKVVPQTVKYRVFGEIVEGMPPTVVEFPENREVVRDTDRLKAKLRSWAREPRAPFFTASVVPILLGTAIAWAGAGMIHWGYFLLTLIGGIFLHAGTNILNDYFDHKSRNDEVNREYVRPFSGGSRMIQLGLLTPLEVLVGGLLFFLAGGLIGLYLVWTRGLFILALGVFGVLSGMFYSGRPFNWGSRGIGEGLVGLNFGVLMTLGAYYVQAQRISLEAVVAGIPVALFIAAVLYINEFPDYHADREVGKRTLVVRLGRQKAVTGFIVLIAAIYLSVLVGVLAGVLPAVALGGLATVPLSVKAIRYTRVYYERSFELAPANALTVMGHLTTGLLLTLAYAWVGLEYRGIGYLALLAVAFGAYAVYLYRHIERQKEAFLGLKEAVRGG